MYLQRLLRVFSCLVPGQSSHPAHQPVEVTYLTMITALGGTIVTMVMVIWCMFITMAMVTFVTMDMIDSGTPTDIIVIRFGA